MTVDLKTLNAFIERNQDEMIDLLRRLVAADTTNPPGNERPAAEIVKKWFDEKGIVHEEFAKDAARPNVIGKVGRGGPSILVPAHLDVVPAGDGWDHDPFDLVIRDGRAYGRGVSDNKGQLIGALLALAFLKERESELRGTLMAAAVADEECGSTYGLAFLTGERLIESDYAIVPDCGGNMRSITVAEKGALFFDIVSHGKQVHGSTPEAGVNAAWNLLELLRHIRAYRLSTWTHPLLSPPTINLGAIHGGSAPNMVPAKCVASIDMRFLPGDTAESILDDLRAIADDVCSEIEGARFDFEARQGAPPCETPLPNPLVDAIQKATKDVIGEEAQPEGLSGTTVVKQLLAAGTCAVGFGPGDSGQAHVANESIGVQDLFDFTRVLVRIVDDMMM